MVGESHARMVDSVYLAYKYLSQSIIFHPVTYGQWIHFLGHAPKLTLIFFTNIPGAIRFNKIPLILCMPFPLWYLLCLESYKPQ